MKQSKTTLISYGLFVAMIACWFIDVNALLSTPLTIYELEVGLHYIFEFPLLALGAYQLGKYHVKWTISMLLSVIAFFIVITPLHLEFEYGLYWVVNSALLFTTVVLSGTLFSTFERRVRKWQ